MACIEQIEITTVMLLYRGESVGCNLLQFYDFFKQYTCTMSLSERGPKSIKYNFEIPVYSNARILK